MIKIENIKLDIKGTTFNLSLADIRKLQSELNIAFPIPGYYSSPWWWYNQNIGYCGSPGDKAPPVVEPPVDYPKAKEVFEIKVP